MRFFNLDCHISVIADLKQIFEGLGHKIDSWSISGHNWVFNRPPSSVDVVTPQTWKNLDKTMCDNFYDRYREELSEYDGFICTYPPSFSLLFERFNKPIILQIPIRYEIPFQNDIKKWESFNDFLVKNIDNKIIIPTANSLYDKKYFEYFVGRECKLIPSICEYTNMTWTNTSDKFLYYSNLPYENNQLVNKKKLGKYQWSDLSKYKGIVMIPYNCSTMSIFEFYTSNIPLFVPSKKFMLELYKKYPNYVLTDLTWNRLFGMNPGSIISCDKTNDPNSYDNYEIMERWISYSDFYNEEWMPFITYFDSFEDMDEKLSNSDLTAISDNMKKFNRIRKLDIYDLWKKVINNLQ